MAYFDLTHQSDEVSEQSHLVGFVKAVGRPVGLITMSLGIITLLGYAFNVEFLYRPIVNGPATSPLTALVVALIAMSFELDRRHINKWIPVLFAVLAASLCIVQFWGLLVDSDVASRFTPFYSVVESDLLIGKNNSMGLNTTLMLFLLTISHLLYAFKFQLFSQFFSFTALCVPTVSITGYAYGLSFFYGHMSLLSTTFGVFLCISALAVTADKGGLKALLSPYIGGKIARIQIVLGYLVPLIVGFLVVRSLVNSSQNSIFGVYVVAICWFIILLVIASAIVQEQVDVKRRNAEQALQYLAMTDELTKLPNRRHFMDAADLVLQKASKNPSTIWFLMIDIDHFKKINDSEGHVMGDNVLIEFSNVLKGFVRPEDLVCRLGGEEFVVLLNGMDKVEVSAVAESIRESISETVVTGYTDKHGHFTASIGCAQLQGDATIDKTLSLADTALYHAKETGRNKVSFAN